MPIRLGLYSCGLIFSTLAYCNHSNPFGPELIGDAEGNVVATWSAPYNDYFVIQQAQRSMTGPWSNITLLSSPTSNAFFPFVCLNDAGTILSMWQKNQGPTSIIEYTFTALQGATAPLIRSMPPSSCNGQSFNPQAILDSDNRAAFVWQTIKGSTYAPVGGICSLFDRRLGEISLVTTNSSQATYPAVAFDPISHSLLFVWQQTNSSHSTICAYTIDNMGSQTHSYTLSPVDTKAYAPCVASSPATAPAIAWHEVSRLAVLSLYDSSAAYLSLDDYTFANPRLNINTSSQMILTAEAHQDSSSFIVAALYDPNTGWSTLQVISDSTDTKSSHPQAAINHAGDSIVIWQDKTNGTSLIKAATYLTNGSWNLPITLSNPSINSFFPSLYLHSTGYTVAAWSSLDDQKEVFIEARTSPALLGAWSSTEVLY